MIKQPTEGQAIELYRGGLITVARVAEMLGIPWFEAQRILERSAVGHELSIDEVIADADSLRELRERR